MVYGLLFKMDMNYREIEIPITKDETLKGDLTVFSSMQAVIVFAHGSDSSRKSPRNQQVASYLNKHGFGTLLFDLLTENEALDRRNIFNIPLLSERLISACKFLRTLSEIKPTLPLGFFGASTGAAAAVSAAELLSGEEEIFAIVSRGGRPDLAGQALTNVSVATLLLVGGKDYGVIELNEMAYAKLQSAMLIVIPEATHLFVEQGAMDQVARKASDWFMQHLPEPLYQFPEMSV